jgi:hypothetical protein
MTNLWPEEIIYEGEKAPLAILKEQASILSSKTKYNISAKMEVNQAYTKGLKFAYNFYITAPTLGFSYKIFWIVNTIELYPVDVWPDGDIAKEMQLEESYISAKCEEGFRDILRAIFNSEKTKRVLGALVAQST